MYVPMYVRLDVPSILYVQDAITGYTSCVADCSVDDGQ